MLCKRLWDYQTDAYNFALAAPGNHAALFCEQGTGKTWIASAIAEKLYSRTRRTNFQFSGLIVAPLSTIQSHDGWRYVLGLTNVKVYTDFEEFKRSKSPRILLLNWEALATRRKKAGRPAPKSRRLADFLIHHPWSFGCFDESQKMKSRNSKQSRLAGRIRRCDYRLLLSGTPFDDLLDDPQEVWAQWRFLNPDLFGTRWADFDYRFLKKTGWMGKKRMFRSAKAQAKVLKMIKPNCLRVTKSVLGLDPPEYIDCPVDMLGKQRRMYEQMEEHCVIQGDNFLVTADLTIIQLVKLQQICGGFVKDDDEEIHEIGRAKLRKLKSVVKKTGYPVVVFAKYIFEVDQIAQELSSGNVCVSTITGKSRRTRAETIQAFQNGKIDILVCQVKTGGVGINLQRAHQAIFYSTTFSYIDFDQAVSRIHRAGQKRRVKIFLLFCSSSIDKDIYKVIISKRNVSELILNQYRFSHQPQQRRPQMAKGKKGSKKSEKSEKSEKKTKQDVKKFTISNLAEELDVEPASARVQLRKHGIPKAGGRYGWDTKSEMMEVVKKLKSKAKARDEEYDDDEEDDDE